MANVLLFHHAQGFTPGLRSFADLLRTAGHVVHTPDLYDGKTFPTVTEGVQHARSLGFTNILERGVRVAEGLPAGLVYGGYSLGVMTAQKLAQTRPGARGALLFSAALPLSEFGGVWPAGVPLQMHMMERDEWLLEGDLDAAREIAGSVRGASSFSIPATGTFSWTLVCPTTTRTLQAGSCSAFFRFWRRWTGRRVIRSGP